MSDIIGVVTRVVDDSYNGKDFKVVTLGTGQELKVKQGREGALKAKWGLLKEGVAIRFIMKDYTTPEGVKIPFVSDIETVEGALPGSGGSSEMLPEHQAEIDKAKQEVAQPAPKPTNPQELGLAHKLFSDAWIAGFVDENTPDGKEMVLTHKLWMRKMILGR